MRLHWPTPSPHSHQTKTPKIIISGLSLLCHKERKNFFFTSGSLLMTLLEFHYLAELNSAPITFSLLRHKFSVTHPVRTEILLLSLSNYSAVIAYMISFPAVTDDCLERYQPDISQTKTGVTGAVKEYLFGHSGLRFCQINRTMKTCSVKRKKYW